jgi:5-methylcytosine-specific restriction endonuclease McrA
MKKTREARWANHTKKTKKFSIRDLVRERDGNLCVRCKMSNEEHLVKTGKRLHIHRKIPGRFGGKYELENCITLCYICHPIVEADIYHPPKSGRDPKFHTEFSFTAK